MVYPLLLGFKSFDEEYSSSSSSISFPLSRASMVQSGCPIFLLDRFTHIIVYYTIAGTDLPTRPTKDCRFYFYLLLFYFFSNKNLFDILAKLDVRISNLRTRRQIVSQITYLTAGSEYSNEIDHYLIEDQSNHLEVEAFSISYDTFIESHSKEALKELS